MSPTAIITGASRGLGRALADALAGRGWRLVIDARNEDELEAARAELAQRTEVLAVAGDVADAWHRGRLMWLAGERQPEAARGAGDDRGGSHATTVRRPPPVRYRE